MTSYYKPANERTPDSQYADRVKTVLSNGIFVKNTPQGIGAFTCFGTLHPMVFDLSNGVPLITDRNISFWRKSIAEIIAFINGARTIDEIESYGCDFWEDYRGKGTMLGLDPDDMGPGSYGPAFHNFEVPEGGTLNQVSQVIQQIRDFPDMRTHLVSPWKPYYTARGKNRKVIVAPCHGWIHFRVLQECLHMEMHQRSADFPIGVPSNMIQYAALLLMMCQVTGYQPGNYVHSFGDAHIYENQVGKMIELVARPSLRLPILRLDPSVKDIFDFRIEHFAIDEYTPLSSMTIPYSP